MTPHRTDTVSFTFGALFLLAAALWLLAQVTGIPWPVLGVVGAGGLMAVGVFGIVLALATRRDP